MVVPIHGFKSLDAGMPLTYFSPLLWTERYGAGWGSCYANQESNYEKENKALYLHQTPAYV